MKFPQTVRECKFKVNVQNFFPVRKYKLAGAFSIHGNDTSDLLKTECIHSKWFGAKFLYLVPDGA